MALERGIGDSVGQAGTSPSAAARLWTFFRHQPLVAAAVLVFVVVVLAALFAPLLSPYPPNEPHIMARLAPPGSEGFLLGTDG